MPEDTPDITGADRANYDAIGAYGHVTVCCLACEANRLAARTAFGSPRVPDGWGAVGVGTEMVFACPEHLGVLRASEQGG